MISVLIFAADAKLRHTLERLSQNDSAITVVGSAEDQESLVRLANRIRVDVVLAQERCRQAKLRAAGVFVPRLIKCPLSGPASQPQPFRQ
jgi:DNA-binding NarL/FixJ family response regulator